MFSPGIFADKKDAKDVAIISLFGATAGSQLVSANQCLRINDSGAFYKTNYKGLPWCDTREASDFRCLVYAHYKGWKVEILMPRRHYNGDYQAYCNAVLDFIGQRTDKISEFPGTTH